MEHQAVSGDGGFEIGTAQEIAADNARRHSAEAGLVAAEPVESGHPMTSGDQGVDEVGAEEAVGSHDENVSHAWPDRRR